MNQLAVLASDFFHGWYCLAVYEKILTVYNRLLYHALGDLGNFKDETGGKVGPLLEPRTSVIGSTMEELLNLLLQWTDKPAADNPWLILRAIGAPVTAQDFSKESRGKILRIISAARGLISGLISFIAYAIQITAMNISCAWSRIF